MITHDYLCEKCGEMFEEFVTPDQYVVSCPVCSSHANRIYVNPFRAPDEMASTVVHELNHFVNDSNAHYATAADIAREEFRAFWVAQQFEDHGRPAGGAWLGWLKRYIVDEYALQGVRVEDLPDRPEGNLDNRVHAGVVSMR